MPSCVPGGTILVQRRDFRAHEFRHFERVRVRLRFDTHGDAGDAVGACDGALVLRRQLNVSDVGQLHEIAIGPATDDEAAEILGRIESRGRCSARTPRA